MKKAIIIISILIAAGIIWFYPVFSPLSKYTDNCLKPVYPSVKSFNLERFTLSNFEQCKIALAENDKKFTDPTWKTKSWDKLYGFGGFTTMFTSPKTFKNIRENNDLLIKLSMDTTILVPLKIKLYKDETSANAILDEFESIVTKYKAYCQINNEPEYTKKMIILLKKQK